MSSYGDIDQIAGMRPRYTQNTGIFSDATNPTETQVSAWITQVSSLIDGIMASNGFTVPVTDTDVLEALKLIVNELVGELCDAMNGQGRFRSGSKETGTAGRWGLIADELDKMIEKLAVGFENMGAARTSIVGNIKTRETNRQGDEIFPLIQRDGAFMTGGLGAWVDDDAV